MTDELEAVRLLRRDDDADLSAVDRARDVWLSDTSASRRHDAGLRPIVPYLIYDEVETAIRWLSGAFGFREDLEARFVDDAGVVQHAELDLFGARVMMGPPSIHGDSPRLGVSSMLDVAVPDVDGHFLQA